MTRREEIFLEAAIWLLLSPALVFMLILGALLTVAMFALLCGALAWHGALWCAKTARRCFVSGFAGFGKAERTNEAENGRRSLLPFRSAPRNSGQASLPGDLDEARSDLRTPVESIGLPKPELEPLDAGKTEKTKWAQ